MSEQVQSKDVVLQAQNFWNKNQKNILIALTAIVVLVGGWYGYQQYIVKPNEEKAADAIYKAQEYFAKDSVSKALNGDGATKGFLYVIKNYGSTKSGNLAHYYAGICYLKLGDFNNAIKHLEDFSTDAPQVKILSLGALGDAYAEAGKKADAVEKYKKAATVFTDDESLSAEYLFRAALLQETLGKTKEALELYKELKEKFPKTDKGFQADKYIARLGS